MVICLLLRISLGGRAALGARIYMYLLGTDVGSGYSIHHARGIQTQILVNSGVLAALRPWVCFFCIFFSCFVLRPAGDLITIRKKLGNQGLM